MENILVYKMARHNQIILLSFLIFALARCQSTSEKPAPPTSPAAPVSQLKPEECADKSVTRLKPALSFLQEPELSKTVENYRAVYMAILRRFPEKPIEEKYQAVIEMVDETSETLKDASDKKCVIERDMISAELMPLAHEVDVLSKRHINGQQLTGAELSELKEKAAALKKIDAKVIKLCQPYRSTLGLLVSEAQLDASYILKGGAAPGNAIVSPESEVDELLGESKESP